MKFGHTLKMYQVWKGVTAPDLAKRMGVASQQIYRWHKCEDAKLSVILKVCEELDVDLWEFLDAVLDD
jgi:DNA-binding Xre family transcriptional regulator